MLAAGGTSGKAASRADQVSRRTAVTNVANAATSPSCSSSTCQCWVVRLVRMMRACTEKPPSAIGAAKWTVWDTGSPRRCGWRITAFISVAAITPPKGPTMLP